jgi:hypothetical protein
MVGKTSMQEIIKTDVDRLVLLVQEEGKISLKDAAKKLNMPSSIVEEWANFLDEEQIIDLEYKFATLFLIKKKMTSKDMDNLKSHVQDEKNILDNKSETLLIYLNKLETEVGSLRDIFNDLDKNFNKRFSNVKKEFKVLQKAEDDKEKLNNKILESKQKFVKRLDDINKSLLKEEADYKLIYDFMYDQSQMEGQILHIQDDELELIKVTDKIIEKKLKELRIEIDKKKSGKDKLKIESETNSNLNVLEKKYSALRDYLESERKSMEDLVEENKKEEEQVELLKKEIISKMKESNLEVDKSLSDIKDLPNKLKLFMEKKDDIVKILNGISYNEKILKDKLVDLRKRSSAINLGGDALSVAKEMKGLEQGLLDIAKRKGFFEGEIKKLFKLLKP